MKTRLEQLTDKLERGELNLQEVKPYTVGGGVGTLTLPLEDWDKLHTVLKYFNQQGHTLEVKHLEEIITNMLSDGLKW